MVRESRLIKVITIQIVRHQDIATWSRDAELLFSLFGFMSFNQINMIIKLSQNVDDSKFYLKFD